MRHHAEEALATHRVARTRLGYEVLVKLKVDEFLLEEPCRGGHSGHQSAPDAITIEVAGEEIDHEGL
jgi:hypothetical protein